MLRVVVQRTVLLKCRRMQRERWQRNIRVLLKQLKRPQKERGEAEHEPT